MKRFSRVLTLLLAAVLVLSLAACHQKNETVMTVGDVTIPSGLYLAFELEAFNQLTAGVQEQVQADSSLTAPQTAADYLAFEYEGLSGVDYVRSEAEKIAVEYAVVQQKFAEFELELTKQESDYSDSYAEYYWSSGYQAFYEANGVSLATFKDLMRFRTMQSMLFTYYYDKPDEETGKGGVMQVSDKELVKQLAEDFVLVDYIASDLTDSETGEAVPDEQVKLAKETMDSYAKRINEGETYAKIYEEATGNPLNLTTVTDTDAEEGSFSIYPSSAGAIDASTAPFDLVKEKMKDKDFAYETAYVLGGTDAGTYYMVIVYDISKDTYYLNQKRATLLQSLKGEDFDALLADLGKDLTIETDQGLAAYYAPDKITLPTA